MKSEENEKIEIHIYVKILARTGERSYFYQIFMRRKQAIPLQGSELFYKAEKKYRWRLFELPRYVVIRTYLSKTTGLWSALLPVRYVIAVIYLLFVLLAPIF